MDTEMLRWLYQLWIHTKAWGAVRGERSRNGAAGIRIARGGAFRFPPVKDPFLVLSSSFFRIFEFPLPLACCVASPPLLHIFLGSSSFSSFLPNIVEVHIFPAFIDGAFFKDLVISVFFITSFIFFIVS